ncbi:MAG TPA: hypothetical protein VF199_08620 [Bacillales bacterium]
MTTNISREAARGAASGIFFMTVFGIIWAITGIIGLQGLGMIIFLIPIILIGITLFICGISLNAASRRLTHTTATKEKGQVDKWFGIISALEFILIGAAGAISGATGHFDWFCPVTALIVGIHFFPLAYLFQVKTHYITGLLLCLLSIITMLFVPVTITLGNQEIIAWWSIVGFGSALILWVSSAIIWFSTRKLLKHPPIGRAV